jgi:hypothetical protein
VNHFLSQIKNQAVLIRSDNTTVVQYINKQGGTKSPQLCYLTWEHTSSPMKLLEHLLLELLCEASTNKIFVSDDCESRQIDLSKDDPRDQIVSVLFPCLKTILLSEFFYGEPSISGYLVIQPEQVTHKLVGIKSCLFDSESFSESNQESGCVDQIRQLVSKNLTGEVELVSYIDEHLVLNLCMRPLSPIDEENLLLDCVPSITFLMLDSIFLFSLFTQHLKSHLSW